MSVSPTRLKISGIIRDGGFVPAAPARPLANIPGASGVGQDSLDKPKAQTMLTTQESWPNLQKIRLDLIDPNPLSPREVYTSEMIARRAEELRTQGQHDAIHVIPNPDANGRYIICDGWTRVQACRTHEVSDSLLAQVHHKLSLREAAWFGYEQNESRSEHFDLDKAIFYQKMIKDGETAADIARRAGISKTQMTFYGAYEKLPLEVMDIFREHPQKFSSVIAYELAKLYEKLGLEETLTLAQRFVDEKQSHRWLKREVKTLLNPPVEEVAPMTEGTTVRYSNGIYKQQGGLFELKLEVLPEHREAFAKGLQELLQMAAQQVEAEKTEQAEEESASLVG